jgi:hypothetical protein
MPRPIPLETKAAALADVLAGMSVNAAAKKHRVSRQAIVNWQLEAGVVAPVLQGEPRDRVGAALDRYICKVIDGLGIQFDHALASNWLKEHGVEGYLKLLQAHQETVARVVEAELGNEAAGCAEPIPLRRGAWS